MPTTKTPAKFSGDRLKARRRAAGLSRTQLAASIERSHWALESWERSEFDPNLRSVLALIRVLGCSLDDLMTNDDPDAANAGPSRTTSGGTGHGQA